MTDDQILTVAWIILAAHIAALVLAPFVRLGIRPLLPVNILVAAIVLAGVGARAPYLLAPPDRPVLGLAGFEMAVIAISIAAWRRAEWLTVLSVAIFVLHLLATIAMLIFMLTFSMTRLI